MTMQVEQPVSWTKLEPVLRQLLSRYGDKLVRLKGLLFDPDFDHPLLVQGSTGLLHPPAHLPARASDDFISRLVFITDGAIGDFETKVFSMINREVCFRVD